MGFASASFSRAIPNLHAGRVDEAIADAQQAIDHRDDGWRLWLVPAHGVLAWALLERGEPDAAASVLDAAAAEAATVDPQFRAYWLYARGRLASARGRYADALADHLAAGEAVANPNPGAFGWRSSAALAAARLGDADRARSLAEEELDLARRFGAARPLGVALRVAGVVSGELDLIREAVGILRGSPAELELIRALTDLGAATRRAGHAAAAREPLREALDRGTRAGALALAGRAREELRLAGGRPRRPRRSGVDALTPAERRVAALAAQGRSNREIAERLFVTRKTVEFHLGRAYRKLGVASRDELARHVGEA
jgi:DNA-binding CsgD family transcriptional regulator